MPVQISREEVSKSALWLKQLHWVDHEPRRLQALFAQTVHITSAEREFLDHSKSQLLIGILVTLSVALIP